MSHEDPGSCTPEASKHLTDEIARLRAALTDKDKRWEKVAADLNERANENERALYAERARAKGMEEALKKANDVMVLVSNAAPGYDWNADIEGLTLIVGNLYSTIKAALSQSPAKVTPFDKCPKRDGSHFLTSKMKCRDCGVAMTGYDAPPAVEKPWECKKHKLIGGTSPSCPLCPPAVEDPASAYERLTGNCPPAVEKPCAPDCNCGEQAEKEGM